MTTPSLLPATDAVGSRAPVQKASPRTSSSGSGESFRDLVGRFSAADDDEAAPPVSRDPAASVRARGEAAPKADVPVPQDAPDTDDVDVLSPPVAMAVPLILTVPPPPDDVPVVDADAVAATVESDAPAARPTTDVGQVLAATLAAPLNAAAPAVDDRNTAANDAGLPAASDAPAGEADTTSVVSIPASTALKVPVGSVPAAAASTREVAPAVVSDPAVASGPVESPPAPADAGAGQEAPIVPDAQSTDTEDGDVARPRADGQVRAADPGDEAPRPATTDARPARPRPEAVTRVASRHAAVALLERALTSTADAPRATLQTVRTVPSDPEPATTVVATSQAQPGTVADAKPVRAHERAIAAFQDTLSRVAESEHGSATGGGFDSQTGGGNAGFRFAASTSRPPAAAPVQPVLPQSDGAAFDTMAIPILASGERVMTDVSTVGGRQEAPAATLHDVPQQIVKAVHMQWREGVGEARLRLQPENLGEVVITLKVEGTTVTASLRAETAAAQAAIQASHSELRAALDEQGLHLDRLVVDVDPDRERQSPRREADPERRNTRQRRTDTTAPQFEILV